MKVRMKVENRALSSPSIYLTVQILPFSFPSNTQSVYLTVQILLIYAGSREAFKEVSGSEIEGVGKRFKLGS